MPTPPFSLSPRIDLIIGRIFCGSQMYRYNSTKRLFPSQRLCLTVLCGIIITDILLWTFSSNQHNRKNFNNESFGLLQPLLIEPELRTHPAPPRIAKCTMHINSNAPDPMSVFERALLNHRTHSHIHGYLFHILREPILNGIWNKPAFILSLLLNELGKPLSTRLEWLLWIDVNTIIPNPYIAGSIFLPPRNLPGVHLLTTDGWDGPNESILFVRIHPWSVQFFSTVLGSCDTHANNARQMHNQSAISTLLFEKAFAEHVVHLPNFWFHDCRGERNQSVEFHQGCRGDFMVQFPDAKRELEIMKTWLDGLETPVPDDIFEMSKNWYAEETNNFWKQKVAKLGK